MGCAQSAKRSSRAWQSLSKAACMVVVLYVGEREREKKGTHESFKIEQFFVIRNARSVARSTLFLSSFPLSSTMAERGAPVLPTTWNDAATRRKMRRDERRANAKQALPAVFEGEHSVYVYFMNYDLNDPSWTNYLVYKATGRLMHVELAFSTTHISKYTGKRYIYSASIVDDGTGVYVERRTFENPAYYAIELKATELQIRAMWEFCVSQRSKPFNSWGMWLSWTPWSRDTDEDAWFCSEYVTAALQAGDMFEPSDRYYDLSPGCATPYELYAMLEPRSKTAGNVALAAHIGDPEMDFDDLMDDHALRRSLTRNANTVARSNSTRKGSRHASSSSQHIATRSQPLTANNLFDPV